MNGKTSWVSVSLSLKDENPVPRIGELRKSSIAQGQTFIILCDILLAFLKSSSKVSLATIYRTLRLLVQMGLLHELELSEGGHRYELLSNETADHHHLICIRCGRTEEFESDEVLRAGKVAAKVNGFKLIESSLNVRAICPNCI